MDNALSFISHFAGSLNHCIFSNVCADVICIDRKASAPKIIFFIIFFNYKLVGLHKSVLIIACSSYLRPLDKMSHAKILRFIEKPPRNLSISPSWLFSVYTPDGKHPQGGGLPALLLSASAFLSVLLPRIHNAIGLYSDRHKPEHVN